MFPSLLFPGHKSDEARVLTDAVQVGISCEEGIAGKAVLCRIPQPIDCLIRLVHQRISGSDSIRSMMKVTVAFADLCSFLNFFLGLIVVPCCGRNHCLEAGQTSAFVLWIGLQGFFNSGACLFSSSELKHCPGSLITPE